MAFTKQETQDAIDRLRSVLKPGQTLYTVLQQVSTSGMSRRIRVVSAQEGGEPWDITRLVAKAIRERYNDKYEALVVSGCGMDMGFQVIYHLSHVLFPDGFDCIGEDRDNHRNSCPASDHNNGDRNYSPDHRHKDSGYALKQRWL